MSACIRSARACSAFVWAALLLALAGCGGGDQPPAAPSPSYQDASPAWSPDGRRIAFIRGTNFGAGELWVMDATGRGKTRLVPDLVDCNSPAWSPDGGRIAFCVGSWPGALYVVDAYGTNSRMVYPEAGSPAWSPEGTRIAGTGYQRLVIAQETGVPTVWDFASEHRFVNSPAWSPDGKQVAFTLSAPYVPYASPEAPRARHGPPPPTAVWVVDTDGGLPRRLTEDASYWWYPCWAPDGTRIAAECEAQVWLIAADGGEQRRLCETTASRPRWSPDGTRIVFGGSADGGQSGIFTVDPANGGVARLTTSPVYDHDPAWSPDGSRIAFVRGGYGWSQAIWVLNADGTGLRNLSRADETP